MSGERTEVNSQHFVCHAPRGRVSLMVVVCIYFSGVGILTSVEGNINAVKCINIIDNNRYCLAFPR